MQSSPALADYFRSQGEAIRFMRAFAGIVLRIPTLPVVERFAREHQITSVLNQNPTTATVRRLAELQGVPMRSIAKTFFKATGRGLKRLRSDLCRRLSAS
jgi:hypothetical protein